MEYKFGAIGNVYSKSTSELKPEHRISGISVVVMRLQHQRAPNFGSDHHRTRDAYTLLIQ